MSFIFSEMMEHQEDSQESVWGCLLPILLIVTIAWALIHTNNTRQKQATQRLEAQVAAEAQEIALQTDGILFRITQGYGYSRFYDTWGGERVMFIPQQAWANLSFEERDFLKKHAKSSGIKSIITGEIKSQNVLSVDRKVWTR